VPRIGKALIEALPDFDRVFVENYAAGINKVAENIVVYPAEFQIVQSTFEKYTAEDAMNFMAFMTSFVTKDWHQEYLRERLTEIYDRELVDQLIPFKKEHYFQLDNMETITDEDLKKVGMFEADNSGSLFDIDESLLHLR
jgi:hypothetical protein